MEPPPNSWCGAWHRTREKGRQSTSGLVTLEAGTHSDPGADRQQATSSEAFSQAGKGTRRVPARAVNAQESRGGDAGRAGCVFSTHASIYGRGSTQDRDERMIHLCKDLLLRCDVLHLLQPDHLRLLIHLQSEKEVARVVEVLLLRKFIPRFGILHQFHTPEGVCSCQSAAPSGVLYSNCRGGGRVLIVSLRLSRSNILVPLILE